MASTGRQIPSVKKKPSRENRITIMIMRSVGKVRSFKVSASIALSAVIFLGLYIIVSIFITNRYFDLRSKQALQNVRVRQLETEVSRNQQDLQRSTQKVAILEDYIRNLEAPKEEEAEPFKNPDQQRKTAYPIARPGADDEDQEDGSASIVDIRDMVIQKDGATINVNFRVVNLQPTENPVGGYIHLIAKRKGENGPSALTFPYEELRDGVPVNFRRGQLFLIQRFKPIHGTFDLTQNSEPPTVIKVFIYDQAGELLLEREFEFSNDS